MGLISDTIKEKAYKSLYLIYGEEAYLRNYYKNALKKALVAEGDNLNYSYFEGAGTDVNEVASLVETMPFMAEHRVIIVENSGWFSKAGSSDSESASEETSSDKFGPLINAFKNMGEDVIVIFSEEKTDKRSKLFKTVSSLGIAEEFKKQEEEQLARWCMNYCKAFNKSMSANTAMYFVSEVGLDMLLLQNELDKLINYCLDKDLIEIRDVDAISTHQITGKIFDMIACITAKRQKEALKLYYDLLALRESPFAILSLLVRQYTQMLEVKDCLNRGYSPGQIAAKTGQKDWLVRKLTESVRKVSLKDLKGYLEACAKADEDIKSGNLTDLMSVEILIVSCSS